MKPPIPYVTAGKLYSPAGEVILALPAATKRTGWADWLGRDNTKSFRFVSASGVTFTAIWEPRKQRSGKVLHYWYAHRQVFGKLRRKYLGLPESVTLAKLEEAAVYLAQLELGEGVEDFSLEVEPVAKKWGAAATVKQGEML